MFLERKFWKDDMESHVYIREVSQTVQVKFSKSSKELYR